MSLRARQGLPILTTALDHLSHQMQVNGIASKGLNNNSEMEQQTYNRTTMEITKSRGL